MTRRDPRQAPIVTDVVRLVRWLSIEWVRRYHRLTIDVAVPPPDEPCMFVANHGFGGLFDVNVMATLAVLEQLDDGREITALTHDFAWISGVGPALEPLGAVPARRDAALAALAAGRHVLVFPGGDRESAKPWWQRNQVQFHGRRGFAEVARAADVPIVGVVTAGAGNTVLVLASGMGLAERLHLYRFARTHALPVNLAIPWGLNAGFAGIAPYLPLPARLATAVLVPIRPAPGESATGLAERVRSAMQEAMDGLTA